MPFGEKKIGEIFVATDFAEDFGGSGEDIVVAEMTFVKKSGDLDVFFDEGIFGFTVFEVGAPVGVEATFAKIGFVLEEEDDRGDAELEKFIMKAVVGAAIVLGMIAER